MMNMDYLQAISLFLELLALTVACLHTFKKDVLVNLSRMSFFLFQTINSFKMPYIGIDHYDDSCTSEQKNYIGDSNQYNGLSILITIASIFYFKLEFWWFFLLYPFLVFIFPFIYNFGLRYILASIIYSFSTEEFLVKWGFLLALVGLSLEVIQVFFTSLWYVLFLAIPLYIYFIKIVLSHILSFSITKKYLLIIGIFIYCLLIYHAIFQ